MMVLAFTACLSASPERCQDLQIRFAVSSAILCTLQAEPILAQWADLHPGSRITGWRCG